MVPRPQQNSSRNAFSKTWIAPHFAELVCRFKQRGAVPHVHEGVGCCKAVDACTDNDDVETKGGAAAAVEERGLFEG